MRPKPRGAPGPDTIRRNYPLLLKRMERLMEISSTLASTLELDRLLRNIIEAAVELTSTEAASILLIDPISGELRFEATTNIEASKLEGIGVPLEGSIAGWIATNAQPLVVPDTRKDPRWDPSLDEIIEFVTRSILGVPLVARDRTIGVLEAINRREGTFSEDDVDTLQSLAAQAAVSIVNARLFQQSDLIAEMVHELRTPLASLTAASHLLAHAALPPADRQELITTLQRETSRLSEMTTSFLDVARLESGRMRFRTEPFDMADLIRECLEVIRPQAAQNGVALEAQIAPGLAPVESDRDKVKQVILNLLTNAVKYNRPNGAIVVGVEFDDEACRVSVTDTGKGIPPGAVEHVFEKFYRVPDSEGYASGTGLGLSIARKMVEALGGDMGLESTEGVGSTFHFRLPFQSPRPRRPTR